MQDFSGKIADPTPSLAELPTIARKMKAEDWEMLCEA
jgi:hypothetical protein